MKTMTLASLALLIVAGCSRLDATETAAAPTANAAHAEPMDMVMMTPASGNSAATRGYKPSMMKMMQGMPLYTCDADVDFNKQMRVHHLVAIDMAEVQIAQGTNSETKALAQKIIADQRREVAQIDAWLQQRGQ